MAAYPLLTAMPQRFDMVPASLSPHPTAQSRVDIAILQSVVSLDDQDSREGIYQGITRTVAQLMKADVCLLATYQAQQNQLIIENNYNLRSDLHSGQVAITSDKVPLICNALERNKPLRLPASSTVIDLDSMNQARGFDKSGDLLATSLGMQDDQVILGLVLVSSHSMRSWKFDGEIHGFGPVDPNKSPHDGMSLETAQQMFPDACKSQLGLPDIEGHSIIPEQV